MKKTLLALCLCLVPTTSFAATTSSDLEALATTLEQNPVASTALDKQLLNLLREPAKTLEARTLPTTAAKYTATIETAYKLMPAGFIPAIWQHPPQLGLQCSAMIDFWDTGPTGGLRMETYAFGKGNCPSVVSAAIARGWAWKLRQVGR
jgi:hypothetical protein